MNSGRQYLFLGLLLVLGFSVRLYKINNPLADWHSWRQADTSAVTRNFVKSGIDLLRPRYDDFTDVSARGLFNPQGYRFVEFPIFNLLHYLVFTIGRPLGNLEFWGRMTSVLASLFSALFLYLIVRRRTTPTTGLLAAFFYLFLPFNIYFTRVILPDPLMVTFFLASLNFWDANRKTVSVIFGSLAVLVKPVAVFFLIPIYIKNFWLAPITLLPFACWRLWSYRFPEGIPGSTWLLNGDGIRFRPAFFRWIFGERLAVMILGKWGLWPFLTGLVNQSSFGWWIIGALLYLIVFATGNVRHDYYQIPIIPIVSILLAIGTAKLVKLNLLNFIIISISLVFMFGFAWYDIKSLYQINRYAIVTAGQAADKILPKGAKVVAPYNGDTAFLYQINRPGFPNLPLPIKDLRDRFHAWYYISVNSDAETQRIIDKYTPLETNPDYAIVYLAEPTPLPTP